MTGRELTAEEAVEILKEMVSGGGAGLEGGAELEVLDEGGQLVFLAPLARHVRLDESGIVWVRPILGRYPPDARGESTYAFDLTVARRRALEALEIRQEGLDLVFRLRSREHARIRPLTQRTKPELREWDSFYYGFLSPSAELDLDSLSGDS